MIEEICQDFHPHIIEMVGFLDYLFDDQAVDLIGRIKKILAPNGFFLTCNINKNPEKIFLDWTLLWPMIYRNEEQFSNVLIHGGFSPENMEIIKKHGISFENKNIQDLMVKISDTIAMNDLKKRGELAKQFVKKNFNWEGITKKTKEVYLGI